VPRKLTAALAVVLPLLVLGLAACGGGDDGNGGGNHLSTEDNLKVDQYKSDIEEFCNLAPNPKTELYDRAYITVVTSVDQLIGVYKQNTDKIFYEALKKRDIKMSDLMNGEAKKLSKCGKDGKAESAKVAQAVQNS
jgi:hypothetical protein